MVRKRTRKYDSDDNDSDSDVDFDFEHQSRPAPKKYSLRERKRAPMLTTDYDYYGLDDEDGEVRKGSSDDEDFEVEADVDINGTRPFFEPEPDVDPQNSEGLIDFEDIIRADIVVNKNKIDYDNLIQKTEIKLTQPKKRGRKPKNRVEDVKEEATDTSLVCEPDISKMEPIEKQECEEDTFEANADAEGNKESLPVEGLPNDKVLENLENGDTKEDEVKTEDKSSAAIEMVMLKPVPVETLLEEGKKVEEDDDDVIVLGEVKQDVIVLDD